MWKVIYVASTSGFAETLKQRMEDDGHLVKLRTSGSGAVDSTTEIMVPGSEIEYALESLNYALSHIKR